MAYYYYSPERFLDTTHPSVTAHIYQDDPTNTAYNLQPLLRRILSESHELGLSALLALDDLKTSSTTSGFDEIWNACFGARTPETLEEVEIRVARLSAITLWDPSAAPVKYQIGTGHLVALPHPIVSVRSGKAIEVMHDTTTPTELDPHGQTMYYPGGLRPSTKTFEERPTLLGRYEKTFCAVYGQSMRFIYLTDRFFARPVPQTPQEIDDRMSEQDPVEGECLCCGERKAVLTNQHEWTHCDMIMGHELHCVDVTTPPGSLYLDAGAQEFLDKWSCETCKKRFARHLCRPRLNKRMYRMFALLVAQSQQRDACLRNADNYALFTWLCHMRVKGWDYFVEGRFGLATKVEPLKR